MYFLSSRGLHENCADSVYAHSRFYGGKGIRREVFREFQRPVRRRVSEGRIQTPRRNCRRHIPRSGGSCGDGRKERGDCVRGRPHGRKRRKSGRNILRQQSSGVSLRFEKGKHPAGGGLCGKGGRDLPAEALFLRLYDSGNGKCRTADRRRGTPGADPRKRDRNLRDTGGDSEKAVSYPVSLAEQENADYHTDPDGGNGF